MVTVERARALVAEARSAGLRRDTGRLPAPDGGTHFVTLVKPEILTPAAAGDAMAVVLRRLAEGEVSVLRCALVPAADFGGRGHLLLHYPRLHRVATDGVHALCSDARQELTTLTESSGTVGVLSAYEALTYAPDLDPRALEECCRKAGIHKLGSGSYASVVELNGRPVTVLNGFLPALAASYHDRTALVGLLECHSRREIGDLRGGLLGALHPAAAAPASLRGALGALAGLHGIALSEGRNGVHLSAGHLEGMFQVWRYFAAADGDGIETTGLGRSLSAYGVPLPAVAAMANDLDLATGAGRTVTPHGGTENLSRDEVLARVRQWCATEKGLAA